MCLVKITAYDQNNNIQLYFHIFKVQGLLLLCTELTLFYIELPENCSYLDQSELSDFFRYINI